MSRKLLRTTLLLTGCSIVLAGCTPGPDEPAPSTTHPPNAAVPDDPSRSSSEASNRDEASWNSSEPLVRYLPLDAPAGMSQAVVVEGLPLVYTRQLLPLDGDGNLVGDGSVEKQVEQVLNNLAAVLDASGSSLAQLVRLNVCADSPETVDRVREQLSRRTDAAVRPAISTVVSPLPNPRALVAVDAVAVGSRSGDSVVCRRLDTVAGDTDCADAAAMPSGGVAYLSGQPDKSPLSDAVGKSLGALLVIADQLDLERSRIVQLKVFVQPATAADEVRRELKQRFRGRLTPPMVFVEWIASAPVEIEMVVHIPPTGPQPTEPVRYFTPPGVKASPTFSRAALVQTDRQVFISGLSARTAGDGEAQVRDVFEQLTQILRETGSDLNHLAKATYYVCDDDASDMLNKLRPEFYDPKRPPAASKATVHGTGRPESTFAMDMIAVPNPAGAATAPVRGTGGPDG